jgi:6-hydroxynicotinate 3-monooxygenase
LLNFADGARAEANVIIGADGIYSTVRSFLLGADPPRFIRAAAYRAIFPTERLNGFQMADCTKWWGPDRHILPYFMTSRRDEVYVIGVVPWANWESEATSLPTSREHD